mmetsp:Transcript_39674/g.71218  ORF Transcript_39674/g.71218 Transcript_39674/m.71218 type:complete len:131 (-) Transcript_39674:718-1110(-)
MAPLGMLADVADIASRPSFSADKAPRRRLRSARLWICVPGLSLPWSSRVLDRLPAPCPLFASEGGEGEALNASSREEARESVLSRCGTLVTALLSPPPGGHLRKDPVSKGERLTPRRAARLEAAEPELSG